MFDIRIEDVNYYYDYRCEGECPKVKATIHIQDEYTHMVPICRTWVFDALRYANRYEGGKRVGAIDLIIEDLVKKMWTALHIAPSKERVVLIDMYLPITPDSFEKSYMNNLFTKYLVNERARDKYYRQLCNSTFGLGIEPDICTLYPEPSPVRQTFIDETLLDIYTKADIKFVEEMFKDGAKEKIKEYEKMKIENVIFNDPATIVFWRDGSKTVVKAQNEPFDKEKGLAMAIAKKVYGNEGNYYNEFKKYIKDEPKEEKNE